MTTHHDTSKTIYLHWEVGSLKFKSTFYEHLESGICSQIDMHKTENKVKLGHTTFRDDLKIKANKL